MILHTDEAKFDFSLAWSFFPFLLRRQLMAGYRFPWFLYDLNPVLKFLWWLRKRIRQKKAEINLFMDGFKKITLFRFMFGVSSPTCFSIVHGQVSISPLILKSSDPGIRSSIIILEFLMCFFLQLLMKLCLRKGETWWKYDLPKILRVPYQCRTTVGGGFNHFAALPQLGEMIQVYFHIVFIHGWQKTTILRQVFGA